MSMQQFDNEEFLSLETFRKTGVGVKSPIWFAEHDGEFLMWTRVAVGQAGPEARSRQHAQVYLA